MKSIFIIIGLLILLVGNVGVNVFKHICQEDGIWTSYFVKTANDHCENEEMALEHAKSCCSSDQEQEKKNCCNDQTEYFKIKLDFYNDPSIVIPSATPCTIQHSFEFVLNDIQENYYTTKYVNPPPVKAGRDILIQHQVFLI